VRLEPQELAVLVYATDKLIRNAPALESFLDMAATEEINFMIGDAIINGDGSGKPVGILNSGALVTQAKATSQAADTFIQQNVADMYARLHPRARANAVWLHNTDVEPQIDLMVTEVENKAGTENVGGFNANLYNPDRNTLKGRPLAASEFCATVGDVGDVILCDLSCYATAVRGGGPRQASSMHVKFLQNEMAFRWVFEVDGKPFQNSPITPFKGSNTLSPFVTLAARA
jgi:HK97 family phage major capsid protein